MTEEGCHHSLQFRQGGRGGGSADLSLVTHCDRTQGNGMKLHQGMLRLGIKKKLFIKRGSHWNRVLREVVMASSWQRVQEHLHSVLRHMV